MATTNFNISQVESPVYTASTTGTDTYTANLVPAPTSFVTGQKIRIKFTTANTGACSLNLNSLGAVNIKTRAGNDPQDGDIAAGSIRELTYDGTNFVLDYNRATTAETGSVEMATDSETLTATDTSRYVNPKQLNEQPNRQIFLSASELYGSSNQIFADGWGDRYKGFGGFKLPDAATNYVNGTIYIKAKSYTTISSISVYVIEPSGSAISGNVVFNTLISRMRANTAPNQDSLQETIAVSTTGNGDLETISIGSGAFNAITLQEGDIIGITVSRVGGDGSDTFAGSLYVQGLLLTLA